MKQPWGSAVALLVASGVTLLGVCLGLEPDVILGRAAVAGLLLGALTALMRRLLTLLAEDR